MGAKLLKLAIKKTTKHKRIRKKVNQAWHTFAVVLPTVVELADRDDMLSWAICSEVVEDTIHNLFDKEVKIKEIVMVVAPNNDEEDDDRCHEQYMALVYRIGFYPSPSRVRDILQTHVEEGHGFDPESVVLRWTYLEK